LLVQNKKRIKLVGRIKYGSERELKMSRLQCENAKPRNQVNAGDSRKSWLKFGW